MICVVQVYFSEEAIIGQLALASTVVSSTALRKGLQDSGLTVVTAIVH